MEIDQVLHMNGGMGESSYANNSLLQQKVMSLTKHITEAAVREVYFNTLSTSLAIADLGCSCGPNTLSLLSQVIKTVERLCQELNHQSPEYLIFLNDLPGNDFNVIFKSLGSFKEKLCKEMLAAVGPCFITGVPASFYGRILPAKTLHFVHSSYSNHWLSQVPEGVENNKGNIYISSTSPPNVIQAYQKQFRRDFSLFLKCRAEELVEGGRMVLTLLGRRSEDPSAKECCQIYQLLAMALNDMVSEGLIEEEKLDGFNVPLYMPCPSEVKEEVLQEGSFRVDALELTQQNWNAHDADNDGEGACNVAKCIRAVHEPLLATHFGQQIMEDAFLRYQKLLVQCMSNNKEKTNFINLTLSLTRKGVK